MKSMAETVANIRQNEIKRIAQDMAAGCCCVKAAQTVMNDIECGGSCAEHWAKFMGAAE